MRPGSQKILHGKTGSLSYSYKKGADRNSQVAKVDPNFGGYFLPQ